MARQDTKLEAEGAEFLVLGNLLIEGIPAYKTYTNLRGYDIVAVWPETNRAARIQVKSRWATDANAHLIKNFECDFVVLARLNRGARFSGELKRQTVQKTAPRFYVLPVEAAKTLTIVRGWSKIMWHPDKFAAYENRWDLISDFLKSPSTEEKGVALGPEALP